MKKILLVNFLLFNNIIGIAGYLSLLVFYELYASYPFITYSGESENAQNNSNFLLLNPEK